MSLISMVLTLKAAVSSDLPEHLGRANYAAVLQHLNTTDSHLVAKIHDGNDLSPITCSGVFDRKLNTANRTVIGSVYYVRITGLNKEISYCLEQAFLLCPPSTWQLHGYNFQVLNVNCSPNEHCWSAYTTYEALAEKKLSQQESFSNRVRLEFITPVSFRTKGMNMPLPLPDLVFGSLVDRWNAFSPLALSPEVRQFCETNVAISNYEIKSHAVKQKNSALRIGGVGRVTYQILSKDPYWLTVMHILADFAMYSGVGVQTATGMGQTRQI